RVQTNNFVRDVLGLRQPNSDSWSSAETQQRIAREGTRAVVSVCAGGADDIDDSLDTFFRRAGPMRSPNKDSSGAFLTIGTGSQILRELGIKKMRLLSSEMKYSGISGFDLEITEYLPFNE